MIHSPDMQKENISSNVKNKVLASDNKAVPMTDAKTQASMKTDQKDDK